MNILIISHGDMAKGMASTLNMICGMQKNVFYVCLSDEEGIINYKAKLLQMIQTINDKHLIILSDIIGGSPYNSVLELISENKIPNYSIIGGVNLPLLILLALCETIPSDLELQKMIEESRTSLSVFEIHKSNEDDEL